MQPRGRKTAPEFAFSERNAEPGVTFVAQSGKVTPFHHADASHGKSGLRPQSPTLTRRFQAAVGSEKEKKIDTEGGMMPRRISCSRRQPVPRTG
ncbi:hypothetical protein ACSPDP_002584 [Escherichia albertii]|uniref:hypothetical protein n=1 Tax=Escherichia albertii TaxID=208962 RepID=UPI0011F16123|nr:hypothetical protein [Escherichia albertii]MCZ9167209.1 hypothetical protein [Escherichia albertii]